MGALMNNSLSSSYNSSRGQHFSANCQMQTIMAFEQLLLYVEATSISSHLTLTIEAFDLNRLVKLSSPTQRGSLRHALLPSLEMKPVAKKDSCSLASLPYKARTRQFDRAAGA